MAVAAEVHLLRPEEGRVRHLKKEANPTPQRNPAGDQQNPLRRNPAADLPRNPLPPNPLAGKNPAERRRSDFQKVRQLPFRPPLLKAASARIDPSQGKIFFEKFLAQQTIGDKVSAPRAVLRLRGSLAGQVFRIRGRSDDSVKIFP